MLSFVSVVESHLYGFRLKPELRTDAPPSPPGVTLRFTPGYMGRHPLQGFMFGGTALYGET